MQEINLFFPRKHKVKGNKPIKNSNRFNYGIYLEFDKVGKGEAEFDYIKIRRSLGIAGPYWNGPWDGRWIGTHRIY